MSVKLKKAVRYVPLILSILLIFALTIQDCKESAELTRKTQTVINQVANASSGGNWWNDFKLMRRLGHVPEYLLLGITSFIAFKKWWKAGIFCVGISLVDEILKEILPGREFDLIDMGFDLAGYVVGILIAVLGARIFLSLIQRKRPSDKYR